MKRDFPAGTGGVAICLAVSFGVVSALEWPARTSFAQTPAAPHAPAAAANERLAQP
jgi:hypothetical protein